MNRLVQISLVSVVALPALSWSKPLVIYGEDNRREVHESSIRHQLLARSTAVMVPKANIKPSESLSGSFILEQKPLESFLQQAFNAKVCEDVPYRSQPTSGICSGFLIAPDLIVTAGHCMKQEYCDQSQWVFDFQMDPNSPTAGTNIPPENLYNCKRIISQNLTAALGVDYGLIQIDRPVTGREPLRYRDSGKIKDKAALVVIGNPSGLPTKVADGANVRSNTNAFTFQANLDTFQGNSGSAVFSEETGLVEGILVRGEDDFVLDKANSCVTINRCDDNGCRGEDATRITMIPEIAVQRTFYLAAEKGDVERLQALRQVKFWVDFYGADGESALIKAAKAGQLAAVQYLLEQGADPTLRDLTGKTALMYLEGKIGPENQRLLALMPESAPKKSSEN